MMIEEGARGSAVHRTACAQMFPGFGGGPSATGRRGIYPPSTAKPKPGRSCAWPYSCVWVLTSKPAAARRWASFTQKVDRETNPTTVEA